MPKISSNMDRQLFLTLTSSAQWLLLISLALLIYSWLNKKRGVQLAGLGLFVALAIYAAWVILSGIIVVPAVEAGSPTSHEAKALAIFMGIVICGVLALIGLFLHFFQSKFAKIPSLIIVSLSLALFFMIYHLQRYQ